MSEKKEDLEHEKMMRKMLSEDADGGLYLSFNSIPAPKGR